MEGWRRAVLVPVADDHARPTRCNRTPTCEAEWPSRRSLTHGGTRLEYFSVPDGPATIAEALYTPLSRWTIRFPNGLPKLRRGVLASLVLGVSNDGKGAEAATARANELLSVL